MQANEREKYLLIAAMPEHNKKITMAQDIIKRAMDDHQDWGISCSFGKDSIVLLDLCLQHAPGMPVINSDSGYLLPEAYETRYLLRKRYNLNLTVVEQDVDYLEIMKLYGLQGINRTPADHDKVMKLLKKDKLPAVYQALGLKGIFWGLRKEESHGRQMLLTHRGTIYTNKRNGMQFASPLAFFKADDIWAYIVSNELPYPAFYDYQDCGMTRAWIRNSSWVTTDGAERGQIVWLKKHYPDLYLQLAEMFPVVTQYV